jgi:hypothetical protein
MGDLCETQSAGDFLDDNRLPAMYSLAEKAYNWIQ